MSNIAQLFLMLMFLVRYWLHHLHLHWLSCILIKTIVFEQIVIRIARIVIRRTASWKHKNLCNTTIIYRNITEHKCIVGKRLYNKKIAFMRRWEQKNKFAFYKKI